MRTRVSGLKITRGFAKTGLSPALQNFRIQLSRSAEFSAGWRDRELLEMTDAELCRLFDELEALIRVDGVPN